jgi:glutamate-ammonia-ligase adenylyltransferase
MFEINQIVDNLKNYSEENSARLVAELTELGFSQPDVAIRRLRQCAHHFEAREYFYQFLPMLIISLSEAATPDGSLMNFERFTQSVDDLTENYRFLAQNPRAVEILVKLFVGSQFLTEILLKTPDYLVKLTQHKRIAEFKSQAEFRDEMMRTATTFSNCDEQLDSIRISHKWELLRIGACDAFHLMDMKSVTLQLSLLADSVVQSCLEILATHLNVPFDEFTVLGFGKLGGEELNYSSDIDLVFLAEDKASHFWTLGQKLIRALMDSTAQGFMYRVDMRLRPWGRSGALVSSFDSYLDYLFKHGQLWEKQALLKARPIAGNKELGYRFLKEAQQVIFNADSESYRVNIRNIKAQIEHELEKKGRQWGEVKAGVGSIRDVEFSVQYLQLAHGREKPQIRTFNTLDALVRLADAGLIQADEYRQLSSGYVFLRSIEHSLQLVHYKQVHSLPQDKREQAYLARRLDYPTAELFLSYYERHCASIRRIFDKYVGGQGVENKDAQTQARTGFSARLANQEPSYAQKFVAAEIEQHERMIARLSNEEPIVVEAELLPVQSPPQQTWKVTIVGHDALGLMSSISGLLFYYGYDIVSGDLFTGEVPGVPATQVVIGPRPRLPFRAVKHKKSVQIESSRRFISVLIVNANSPVAPDFWEVYKEELTHHVTLLELGMQQETQGELARKVGRTFRQRADEVQQLQPVMINVENTLSETSTVLDISGDDIPGFLYELANGLALFDIQVNRFIIRTVGKRVADTLYVTDREGRKITDEEELYELKAVVVLIKHFSHLLPRSSNPEAALLHFREFLVQLLEQEHWVEQLASVEQPEVLDVLARLLGGSHFLWEDFLRLQHANLFPVVTNVEALAERHTKPMILTEIQQVINDTPIFKNKIKELNAFKDRQMLRTDLRHILGYEDKFDQFSYELTDIAEVVVEEAVRICEEQLQERYGKPLLEDGRPCAVAICALGKCGGRELGFASDIELMFLYEDNGMTDGAEQITNPQYYQKLVEMFQQSIIAKRKGIFEVDLRLRPYGRAGNLAVSLDAFTRYFEVGGAAWPFERQALVKLRAFSGTPEFCQRVEEWRDQLIYTGEPFDVAALRGMRERQISQLVKAGTINAKLSPGGLVDCEYLVQALQITFAHLHPDLKSTNTREAMKALEKMGVLSSQDRLLLRDCYRFLRRLIDALRMVRGDARDLTVPEPETEELEFLARRLGYQGQPDTLYKDLEQTMDKVIELTKLLDELIPHPATHIRVTQNYNHPLPPADQE